MKVKALSLMLLLSSVHSTKMNGMRYSFHRLHTGGMCGSYVLFTTAIQVFLYSTRSVRPLNNCALNKGMLSSTRLIKISNETAISRNGLEFIRFVPLVFQAKPRRVLRINIENLNGRKSHNYHVKRCD